MPRDVDPAAPPQWVQVGSEPRALWHDHRVHWMSRAPPGFVEAGPLSRAMMRINLVGVIGRGGDQTGIFQQWMIPVASGGQPAVLGGEMAWDDPPGALPWLLLAGLLVAPALLGLRHREVAALVRPAAIMVLMVASVNTIHLVDDLVAWPSHPLDELFGLLHTGLFLGIGIGASLWAVKVDSGRVLALGIACSAVLYHQGFVHLPFLAASHFPTIWPPGLVRLTVALGLVQLVPVLLTIWRARAMKVLPPRLVRPPRERTGTPNRWHGVGSWVGLRSSCILMVS